jgi:hypothetical protein
MRRDVLGSGGGVDACRAGHHGPSYYGLHVASEVGVPGQPAQGLRSRPRPLGDSGIFRQGESVAAGATGDAQRVERGHVVGRGQGGIVCENGAQA